MNQRQGNLLLIIIIVTVIAVLQPAYRIANKIDMITLGLDLKGGVSVLLQAVPPQGQPLTPDDMTGLIEVIRNRVDPQGQRETVITVVGRDRVLVQVPGESKADEILKLIGQTAMLEFLDVGDKTLEDGYDVSKDNYPVILTGRDFANAFPTRDSMGRPAVGFEFKAAGADVFGRFTQNNVNRYMAIALDKKIISCPVIRSAIWGGKGIIEGGNFSVEGATLLANQLKGGALPVPVSVLESRVIGPSLGQESIDHSLIAGAVGFVIILLMMIVMYRLPGLVANFALLLYIVLTLGYLSLFGVTMTLPGIAGFILSVGMAIDANIIIYERLKEELSWGKTLMAALEAAFARAWVAILDGNLTTVLAALVLFFFGTGPVKGFAITLSIGIFISMFSAITVVRFILGYMVLHFKKTSLYA
jgi:preprotein translocase subunit SecD